MKILNESAWKLVYLFPSKQSFEKTLFNSVAGVFFIPWFCAWRAEFKSTELLASCILHASAATAVGKPGMAGSKFNIFLTLFDGKLHFIRRETGIDKYFKRRIRILTVLFSPKNSMKIYVTPDSNWKFYVTIYLIFSIELSTDCFTLAQVDSIEKIFILTFAS